MTNSGLEERVTRAAEATLAEQGYISAIDVLVRLGWLARHHTWTCGGRVGSIAWSGWFRPASASNRLRCARCAPGPPSGS
jgi:hypothetical protein